MDKVLKVVETFLGEEFTKETTLWIFAFFVCMCYLHWPHILQPAQESIKSAIPVSAVNKWVSVAQNFVIFWNLVGCAASAVAVVWGPLMLLFPHWRKSAGQRWSKTAEIGVWWLLRSSIWWWNLLAVQILLSAPVSFTTFSTDPFLNKLLYYTLLSPYPAWALFVALLWVFG